ncbi:MAG: hypothetical protein JSU74_10915 [Candidatus Zixiibacteriota bacterium]|nr:MAG: hypothetical protein JSU74_10915 [candidate division Zixibacteria bacterium]
MRTFRIFLTVILCLTFASVAADSEFMEKFKSDYGTLDLDLLNNLGEIATVENFVYQKDIATFTFEEGKIHLLRYVDDRPTTAIFTGKGRAEISVPSHLERMSLLAVTKDSVVSQEFEVCLMRIADDFDLKLKEQFPVEEKELKWSDFTKMKQAQGEVYFRPVIQHRYDNYFQLLRSLYERGPDGFFWIDFNRYNFCFDPNRPEQVVVSYEFEPADKLATDAVCLPRAELRPAADIELSDLSYPTTAVDKQARIEMGGIDGTKIEGAEARMRVVVNSDSLKYVSTFLHFNLKEDSIYFDGQPVDYHRRKDFNFIGIILPRYYYRGDTLTFTYWSKGKEYGYALPYVEDPTPSPHSFTFITPKGFNYLMPGMGEVTELNGKQQFQVIPQQSYDKFYFQAYASGHDTLNYVSDIGITVNFLKAKHITKRMDCFVPDAIYENTIMDAFNYMSARVGPPAGTFEIYVYPENYYTMPGLIEVPKILCYDDGGLPAFGGFNLFAGYSTAKQWFGNQLKPKSEREFWLRDAASEYLNLLFIQNSVPGGAYYTNLLNRRDSLYTFFNHSRDRPLATGLRTGSVVRCNKGVWLFHMLRYLMFDIERQSEDKFFRFFYELCMTCNNTRYTNQALIDLAEKHYGGPLDWFFKQWLCGIGYPEYDVEYTIEQKDDGYFISGTVKSKNVTDQFQMPVMMRVQDKSGESQFLRENIEGTLDTFELGPFASEPEELVFNELYSVLSKDKVSKK